MYEQVNFWIYVFFGSFSLFAFFTILIGILADKKKKKRSKEFWDKIRREDIQRRL